MSTPDKGARKSKKLSIGQRRAADRHELKVSGPIDEAAAAILGGAARSVPTDAAPVRIDLGGVTTLNSPGVAAFSKFVDALAAHHEVELCACPVSLIDYANISVAFLGATVVASVFFPFRCLACSHADEVLVSIPGLDPKAKIPLAACAKCGAATRPEVEEENFFGFLDLLTDD